MVSVMDLNNSRELTPQATVEEVVRYKTKDGKVHDTRAEAEQHDRDLALQVQLRDLASFQCVERMDAEELAEWLFDHRVAILKMMVEARSTGLMTIDYSKFVFEPRNFVLTGLDLASRSSETVVEQFFAEGGAGHRLGESVANEAELEDLESKYGPSGPGTKHAELRDLDLVETTLNDFKIHWETKGHDDRTLGETAWVRANQGKAEIIRRLQNRS